MADYTFVGLDCEEIYESVSRMRKAMEKKYAPVQIDRDEKTGIFNGSASVPYYTTLVSCTCADFSISGKNPDKPCKHMYRLAHELGVCNLNEIELWSVYF